MRFTFTRLLLGIALVAGCGKQGAAPAGSGPVELKTDEQRTFYALGLSIGGNVRGFRMTPQELAIVQRGLGDAVTGAKPEVELAQFQPKINELFRARSQSAAEEEKKKGREYAEKAAKESGAVKTDSGMVFRTLKPGSGESPKVTDTVKVHYEGKLIDGTVFDSSKKRGQPTEFPLNRVIPCWTEGVQRMKVGETAQLVCPSTIAYGDRGTPQFPGGPPAIPGGATLTFEVELLEIKKEQPAATTPPPPAPAATPPKPVK